MDLRRLDADEALPAYGWLHRRTRTQPRAFAGFRAFFDRLLAGDFMVLRRRFRREVFALYHRSRPLIMATHYAARRPGLGHPHSLGALVADDAASAEQAACFLDGVADALSAHLDELVLPLNGHLNLGLGAPQPGLDGARLHFLTSAGSPGLDRLLGDDRRLEVERELLAFHTELGPATEQRLGAAAAGPPHLTARPIALGAGFRRDVETFNRLVNRCMQGHYGFYPLAPDEEWDLLRQLRPALVSDYFLFLLDRGRPVGFCFGVPDYNPVLRPGIADARNGARLLLARRRHRRARVIYSGIESSHRGNGVFPLLRARVLLNMMRRGVQSVESSYVDTRNARSQRTVLSTGGRISHRFHLYRYRSAPAETRPAGAGITEACLAP
jgi:hypothetical protein